MAAFCSPKAQSDTVSDWATNEHSKRAFLRVVSPFLRAKFSQNVEEETLSNWKDSLPNWEDSLSERKEFPSSFPNTLDNLQLFSSATFDK